MSRMLLDTNVLVTATMRDAPGHAAANSLLSGLLSGSRPWCLTWTNLYEFTRVVTHPRVFPNPLGIAVAMGMVETLRSCPSLHLLTETTRHMDSLSAVIKSVPDASGSFLHDCRIAALMVEHDVKIVVTSDSHFRRFQLFQVLSPEKALQRISEA